MGSKERRLSDSIAFKIEVVNYAEKHGNRAAEGRFGSPLTEKTIREWRKQRKDLIKSDKIKKTLRSYAPKTKLNSVALVRERTIPTERSAKLVPTFADRGVSRGQRNESPRPFNLCFLDLEPLLFYSSSSSIDLTRLTRLSGPLSRPPTTQKIW